MVPDEDVELEASPGLLEASGAADPLEDPESLDGEELLVADEESDDPELDDEWAALPFPFPLPTPPLPFVEAPKAPLPIDNTAAAASAAEPAQTDLLISSPAPWSPAVAAVPLHL